MGSFRILIADDHEVVRQGVRSLLEAHPGWEVIAEASDGRDAVEKVAQLGPDVVILDIGMPNLNVINFDPAIMSRTDGSRLWYEIRAL